MDFFAISKSDGELRSLCLLTLMELILIPNGSLVYLHSNDINSLKSLILEKSYELKKIYIYI